MELINGEPGAENISASIFQNQTSPEIDSPCLQKPSARRVDQAG